MHAVGHDSFGHHGEQCSAAAARNSLEDQLRDEVNYQNQEVLQASLYTFAFQDSPEQYMDATPLAQHEWTHQEHAMKIVRTGT